MSGNHGVLKLVALLLALTALSASTETTEQPCAEERAQFMRNVLSCFRGMVLTGRNVTTFCRTTRNTVRCVRGLLARCSDSPHNGYAREELRNIFRKYGYVTQTRCHSLPYVFSLDFTGNQPLVKQPR